MTPQPESSASTFLDLRVHPWTHTEQILHVIFGFLIIILVVGCLRIGLPFWAGAGLFLPVFLLVFATVALLGLWIRAHSTTSAINALLAQPPDQLGDATQLFTQIARCVEAKNYRSGLQRAARRLAQSRRGFAVRYHFNESPSVIEQIAVNFEPCPLDEVNPTFRGIALSVDEVNEAEERSQTRRFLGRTWRLGVFSLGAGVYLYLFLAIREAWLARVVTDSLLTMLGMIGLILVFQYSRSAPNGRVLLVPGGLVYRAPWWLPVTHSPHLFLPEASVLIAYPIRETLWGWVVADLDRSASGVGSELEVRTLLRAWLSPLPPPTVELLRGLAGE